MGNRSFYLDWWLFIPALLLVSLGLVTLLSIDTSVFYQQLILTVASLVAFYIFSRIDFSIYPYLDKVLLVGSILFLLLSYLGPNVRGATRWLALGPFSVQPSEIVKPFFLICISSLMVRYPPTKLLRILAHTGLFLVVFLIVLRQPDLGSALVYASMWITAIILAGVPLRYLVGSVSLFTILLPVFYELLHGYQKQRIITFLNPLLDPQGTGYNAIQSMISVGSGQLFGRGFGRGTQSLLEFLPERHTDFIFASFSEEFGFVGSLILLAIFFFLLMQLLKRADMKQQSPVAFLFIGGYFAQLFTHVFINVGMNSGVVPITGITLPFVSYGGSSLVATFIGLGMCMAALQKGR